MKTFTNTEALLNNPIRILLVDDSPYFLDALRDFLHLQTTVSVVGTATEGQVALAQARRLNPDIILLDLNLGQQSGLALIPLFKQHVPKAKIVILTIMLDETYRTAAMQAGADAFVHKTEMSGTLLSTIFGLAEVSATDVPERKSLFESGGQFRTLFENAPIGIGVADLQGNLLAFNDAMLIPGQYSRADIEQMGNVAALYYDPQERAEALALFQQQGFVKGFEARFRRKDGSPYHAVLSLTRTIFNGGPAVQAVVEDVTERRQAQEAVREAELRYRSLFEQTHDAIFILDLEGRHLVVNQRAADMLEYSLDEIRGLSVRELSAEPEKSSDVLQRLIAGEQVPVYERLFRKKSGGIISVEINVELVRDTRGNPLHIQSAVRDITERKQAGQALQDSQSQLQSIFNSAMDAIISIDEDQRIVIFNPAAELMYGCAAVEVIGKPLSRFIPEDIRHRHGDFVRAFGQSNSTQRSMELPALALTCLRANGESFPSEVSISQSEIGEKKLYTAIVRDITERRRDESSLRLQGAALEATANGIVITDRDGRIQWVNAAYTALTGYSLEEVKGKKPSILNSGRQDKAFYKNLWDTILSGKAWHGEMVNKRKDGSLYNDEMTITPLFGENDVITHFIGVKQNITERKRADETIRQSEDRYRDLVEHIHDLIGTHDLQGNILSINPSASKLLGIDTDTLLKMNLRDLLVPEARIQFNDYLASIQRDGQASGVMLVQTASGEKRIWEYDNTLRADSDNGPIVRALARDVTERSQAEEALRESEKRYHDIFNGVQEAIFVETTDGRILAVNERACEMYGYSHDEFITKTAADLVPQDHPILWADGEGQTLSLMPVETFNRRANGAVFPIEISGRFQTINGEKVLLVVARDITERKQAEEKIRMQLERLTALREIDQTINATFDISLSLNALVLHTARLLSVDAVSVLLLDPITNMLEYGAGVGFWTDASKSARVKLGQSYAGRAAKEQRIVDIPNLADEPGNMLLTGLLGGEKFVSYYGTPLIVKGKVIGVLEVFHRSVIERDGEWFDFFNTLAGQAAIAIDNAKLFENLQITNTELINAYEATIEGWSRALDLRDEETEGHTLRVTEKAVELARLMGFSDEELVHVRRGGLLHDIGKMGVPDNILLKPAALTNDEWKIMRRHPVFAFELLSPIRYLKSAAIDIPYCHHEKWDGTGYPRGLKGEQIPLAARIFSIVDVYDALTSDRPYRAKWTHEKTLDYIKSLDGIQFDPQVLKVFLESLS